MEEEKEPVMEEARKSFSRLGLRFFFGTIIIEASQVLVIALIRTVKPQWLNGANARIILSALTLYLIGMPALIFLLKKLPAQEPPKHKMKAGHFVLAAIMSLAIMYIFNILGTMLTGMIGRLKGSEVQNVLNDAFSGANIFLVFIDTVIIAPVFEEYVFRKLIVDRTMRYGQGTAVILSGLMFGLFHGNLSQFTYTFVLGLFLAFLYVKTGNLKITIGLHMLINFMGGVVSMFMTEIVNNVEADQNLGEGTLTVSMIVSLCLLLAYEIVSYGSMLAGGIMLISNFTKGRFKTENGQSLIPREERFRVMFLNLGMFLYVIFWIGVIVAQLCA